MEPLPKNRINRLDNLAHADKVHIGQTWYENGIANPGTIAKQLLKDAGTALTVESARRKAIQKGRDLR